MHSSGGFTLIELSLSIAFISVLSIIVVVLINGTISSYNRGLTLNRINTGGMDLVDEFRSALQNSKDGSALDECDKFKEGDENGGAYSECVEKGGKNFVSIVRYASIKQKGHSEIIENIPVYGALCTGLSSYIWNSGYFSSDDYTVENGVTAATLKYNSGDGSGETLFPNPDTDGGKVFRLIRIDDEKRAVCASQLSIDNNGSYNDRYETSWESGVGGSEFDISDSLVLESGPEEILPSDGHNDLAIYYLDTAIPAESKSSKDIFYSVSMILGTVNGGINLSKSGDFCATPNEALQNMDFCAVNKFNFAVQANGV
ncbi:prepilin-type N-terminal cleavage/methylation domain-containing protein [Candidatus Saccharibacteria bacterium]|nr:prepilin-type N-terminal cleavage/methylation domain-containing protein [Candidatus Saccharibacteria bacterium]